MTSEQKQDSPKRVGVSPNTPPLGHPNIHLLVRGELQDPHTVLGIHDGVVRAYRPGASKMRIKLDNSVDIEMEKIHPAGVFAAFAKVEVPYFLEANFGEDLDVFQDPYSFWPTLGELDLHLISEGSHRKLWEILGAHPRTHQGVQGTSFALWAPNAISVRVVGDFNFWDGRIHPMRTLGSSGIWEIFIPGVKPGARYKFEILSQDHKLLLKADPFAFAAEVPPGTASIVFDSNYQWQDGNWFEKQSQRDLLRSPMAIYELHLGSWRHRPEESDRPLTYRELAETLPKYILDMGFTHVEFMPVAEHPFGGSWGYQVSSYFAPTSRFGTPDDFRHLVDSLHQYGIGVIVDWVPAHFPKDDWALARFDGTALYEHQDPRQGEHPDWGTLVFNFGRREVRNFLIANALYWVKELHIDGLRVDAVASMLYLDYSRKQGEWIPNKYGGRENLEAVEFLKELNTIVYEENPQVATIAEESTAWPGVSRPVYLGGLGFGFKWNMGWMHDTLDYFSKDPIYRHYHHNDLTFGLLYAFSENFILPLSHDEVVHGKGSLIDKMPGDKWQKMANLRALFAWMWAHPGKKLIFMGSEFGQWREWSHERSLDWHLLDDPQHLGITKLIQQLNTIYSSTTALFAQDFSGEGFRWIDASDVENNVISFLRIDPNDPKNPLCAIANLSPVPRHDYRIGLPYAGNWREILNTDSLEFGGSGVGNEVIKAESLSWHGLEFSAALSLPPLGVLWLKQ